MLYTMKIWKYKKVSIDYGNTQYNILKSRQYPNLILAWSKLRTTPFFGELAVDTHKGLVVVWKGSNKHHTPCTRRKWVSHIRRMSYTLHVRNNLKQPLLSNIQFGIFVSSPFQSIIYRSYPSYARYPPMGPYNRAIFLSTRFIFYENCSCYEYSWKTTMNHPIYANNIYRYPIINPHSNAFYATLYSNPTIYF